MYSIIIKYSLSIDVRNQIMYCANLNILGRKAKKSEGYFLCPNLRCKLNMPIILFLLFTLFQSPLCVKTDAFQKKKIRFLNILKKFNDNSELKSSIDWYAGNNGERYICIVNSEHNNDIGPSLKKTGILKTLKMNLY